MMSPKVFRLRKFRRWYALVVGLMGFGVLSWLMVMLFRSTSLFTDFLTPLIGVTLFMMLFLGYMIWMIWSYRIGFFENELKVSRYGIPFARPFQCEYENIAYVRRPIMKGSIEVIPTQGRPFQFILAVEGGSDAVMDEFEKHIGTEKFQMDLRHELKKYSILDKATIAIITPMLVVAIMFFLPKLFAGFVAWETFWSPGVGGNMNSFWFDQDGDLWLSYNKPFSEITQIVQMTQEKKNHWSVDRSYFDLVLADGNGLPWIIQGDEALHWQGLSWKSIPFNNYTVRTYTPVAIIDGKYWTSAYSKEKNSYFLINIDLNSEQIQVVNLPSERASENYIIQGLQSYSDGSLLVMVTKPYSPVFFYQLKNNEWKKKIDLFDAKWRIPVFFGWEQDPRLDFGGFTIDTSDRVWVVVEKESKSMIGQFDEDSTSWQWSSIESDCDLCSSSYEDIVIDDNGRVWITAEYGRKATPDVEYGYSLGYGVDVFVPHWGQSAERVMRYTRDNSNYQLGIGNNGLRRSDDGRIWTAYHRLVWIDSSDTNLPIPFPDWFANMISMETFAKVNYLTIGIYLVWLVVYFFVSKLHNRSPIQPKNS